MSGFVRTAMVSALLVGAATVAYSLLLDDDARAQLRSVTKRAGELGNQIGENLKKEARDKADEREVAASANRKWVESQWSELGY
jgi:uncharacterized protein YunC (DUF1805 family)